MRGHLPGSAQTGDFAIEQILKEGNGLAESVSSNSMLVGKTVNNNLIDLQYEVTGFGNVQVGLTFDDGMNVNAENVGKSTTDKEGNSLPEDAGLAFRTQDVLDDQPLITNVQVGIVDTDPEVLFDINLDGSDNDLGEGFVTFDPSNKIDGQFVMHDEDPTLSNSSYASSTTPGFEANNHPEQQKGVFDNGEGSRSITFFIELQDQSGTTKDVVTLTISENQTGTWPTTEDQFSFSTNESRNRGSKSDPVLMDYDGLA